MIIKKSFLGTILLSAIVLLSSCATLLGNNSRRVSVESDPSNAAVYFEGRYMGTTPTRISLPTYIYGGKTIKISKPGFEDANITIDTAFQPITILNIFFPIGFVVDVATGDMVQIDPLSKMSAVQLQRK